LISTDASDLVYVWDLRLIREELTAMHLDRDAPPLPKAKPATAKRLSVSIKDPD
jgi:hypothetical protein